MEHSVVSWPANIMATQKSVSSSWLFMPCDTSMASNMVTGRTSFSSSRRESIIFEKCLTSSRRACMHRWKGKPGRSKRKTQPSPAMAVSKSSKKRSVSPFGGPRITDSPHSKAYRFSLGCKISGF